MTKTRYWALVVLSALVALFLPITEAFARGGGGRGGGGGGRGGGGTRGGGGAAGRAGAAASRGGGRGGRNSNRKDEEQKDRREEREARVSEARLLYAIRERNRMWDAESSDRFGDMLRRILGGSS